MDIENRHKSKPVDADEIDKTPKRQNCGDET